MRQEPSDQSRPTNTGRRIVLSIVSLIGASLIVAACVVSNVRPAEPESADVSAPATQQVTVASPLSSGAVLPTAAPTSLPSLTPTATAVAISPISTLAGAGVSSVYTPTQPFTGTASSVVPSVDAGELTDLLAMTVTQPITLANDLPVSEAIVVSHGFTVSEAASITVEFSLTGTLPITKAPGAPSAQNDGLYLLLPTPTPGPRSDVSLTSAPTPDGIPRSVQLPILMYHYVSIPPAGADIYRQDLSIAPADFAAHLDRMLADGYTAISLYGFLDHLTLGTPLPEKPVIITFDDGYRDNYENAFPALAERDMTATFFVVTDFIDEEREAYFSWDMLREMLDAGMSIESHGRNHVTLKGQGADYLIWQALGSMETIEYELGKRPRFISYPAGEYDQATMDIFKSANFWAGLTTVQGATHDSENLFELRRVRVRGTTTPDELSRLLALDW